MCTSYCTTSPAAAGASGAGRGAAAAYCRLGSGTCGCDAAGAAGAAGGRGRSGRARRVRAWGQKRAAGGARGARRPPAPRAAHHDAGVPAPAAGAVHGLEAPLVLFEPRVRPARLPAAIKRLEEARLLADRRAGEGECANQGQERDAAAPGPHRGRPARGGAGEGRNRTPTAAGWLMRGGAVCGRTWGGVRSFRVCAPQAATSARSGRSLLAPPALPRCQRAGRPRVGSFPPPPPPLPGTSYRGKLHCGAARAGGARAAAAGARRALARARARARPRGRGAALGSASSAAQEGGGAGPGGRGAGRAPRTGVGEVSRGEVSAGGWGRAGERGAARRGAPRAGAKGGARIGRWKEGRAVAWAEQGWGASGAFGIGCVC
jgi:hypothetical protein